MKKGWNGFPRAAAFVTVSLLLLSSTSARLLPNPSGDGESKGRNDSGFANLKVTSAADDQSSHAVMEADWDKLCEDEDGECIKRRVMGEAHLDYIYNHNYPNKH